MDSPEGSGCNRIERMSLRATGDGSRTLDVSHAVPRQEGGARKPRLQVLLCNVELRQGSGPHGLLSSGAGERGGVDGDDVHNRGMGSLGLWGGM
jgi:hypothetical protein